MLGTATEIRFALPVVLNLNAMSVCEENEKTFFCKIISIFYVATVLLLKYFSDKMDIQLCIMG